MFEFADIVGALPAPLARNGVGAVARQGVAAHAAFEVEAVVVVVADIEGQEFPVEFGLPVFHGRQQRLLRVFDGLVLYVAEGGAIEDGDLVRRHAVDRADVEGGEVVGANEFGIGRGEADGLKFYAVFKYRKLAGIDGFLEVATQGGDAFGAKFAGVLEGPADAAALLVYFEEVVAVAEADGDGVAVYLYGRSADDAVGAHVFDMQDLAGVQDAALARVAKGGVGQHFVVQFAGVLIEERAHVVGVQDAQFGGAAAAVAQDERIGVAAQAQVKLQGAAEGE